MGNLARHVRSVFRSFSRTPGLAALALAALAIGIGANTTIFSLLDAILLRPLPYPEPERLVALYERTPAGHERAVSGVTFDTWGTHASSYVALAAITGGPMALSVGEAKRVAVVRASPGFFQVFGVNPVIGRAFTAADDRPGAPPVTLLSHACWQRRFGGDPGVIGRTIVLDEKPTTVLGVMPAGFRIFRPFELLMPSALNTAAAAPDERNLFVVARLRPGISRDRARRELERLTANLATSSPGQPSGWSAGLEDLHERMTRGPRQDIPILGGAAAFVLLIACANVAGLLLAQGAARRRELAIRAALGCGRARLVRQLLAESVVLATGGGVLGVLLAGWLLRIIGRAVPATALPPGADFVLDLRVLSYTLALSVFTGVIFGLVPAWRSSRVDLLTDLKDAAPASAAGGARLRSGLVTLQLALSLVLAAGACLMVRSLATAEHLRAGFDGEHVLTIRVDLPASRYADPDRVRAFYGDALERLGALPGAQSAGLSTELPMRGWGLSVPFAIREHPPAPDSDRASAHLQISSAGYFDAVGMRLRRGRGLAADDTQSSPRVAVVNETFARRFFREEDPLGKHVRFRLPGGAGPAAEEDWEVVGIVEAVGLGDVDRRSPEIYVGYRQQPVRSAFISLRTMADPLPLVESVRAAVRARDQAVLVSEPRTLEQIRYQSFAIPRVLTSLLAGFGGLALLLSAMGIYGLMGWMVTQRTRELGIRATLGAGRRDLLILVAKQALTRAGIGIALGLAGAYALTRVLRHLLLGVAPGDPLTLIVAAALLLAVTLVATWLPARRASRVDPIVALRAE